MSHDNISDIHKVLYGDLNPPLPDTHNEDYYVPELCQLSRTESVYTSLCRLSFQVQFKNFIPTNKLLAQAYFYNIILKQAAPASPRATVSPVRTARLAPSTSRPSTVLRSPATPRSSSSTSSSTPPPVRSLETSLSRVSS